MRTRLYGGVAGRDREVPPMPIHFQGYSLGDYTPVFSGCTDGRGVRTDVILSQSIAQ
jgi:hypothetical protein